MIPVRPSLDLSRLRLGVGRVPIFASERRFGFELFFREAGARVKGKARHLFHYAQLPHSGAGFLRSILLVI